MLVAKLSIFFAIITNEIMLRVLLFKNASSPIIAHVYEHMAMNQFKQLVHQARLLRNIDYSALGTHYLNTGFFTIDIDLYTSEAELLAGNLQRLKSPAANSAIRLAMQQISSETEQVIACNNPPLLKQEITRLDSKAWQSIGELEQPINTLNLAEHKYLSEIDRPSLSVDHVSYIIKKPLTDDLALLSLFHYLAATIHDTVADIANYKLGYYHHGSKFTKEKSQMALETEFTVLSHLANNDKVQHIYNSVISNMLKKPTLSRIVRRLKSFSYDEGKMNVPNIDDHILELGVVIGEPSWRQFANEETISKLLKDIVVEPVSF